MCDDSEETIVDDLTDETSDDMRDWKQKEICSLMPYMSNMKAISLHAIAHKTFFVITRKHASCHWFRCKYCSVRIGCVRKNEEEEFDQWTSTVFGEHDHPPDQDYKVRPIECYLELVVSRYSNQKNMNTQAIIDSVRNEFGYQDLDKNMIIYQIRRLSGRFNFPQQWQMLPDLVRRFENCKCVIKNSVIKRVYFELKTIKILRSDAFVGVVFLDGTHCSDKLQSTLLVACTITADHLTIPLAFVVGCGENKKNYSLLLESMKPSLPSKFVIMSDDSKAISSAIEETLAPEQYQRKICAFHRLKNLAVNRKKFYKMLRADSQSVFESSLESLKTSYPAKAQELDAVAKTYAFMGESYINSFGLVADSPVESVNSALKSARKKEPVDLIVDIVRWTNQQIWKQRELVANQRDEFCQGYTQSLNYRKTFKDSLVVRKLENMWVISEYSSRGKVAEYVVRPNGNNPAYCSCKGYDRDGIPCRHLVHLNDTDRIRMPVPWPCHYRRNIIDGLAGTEMDIDITALNVQEDLKTIDKGVQRGRPPIKRKKSRTEHLFRERRTLYKCSRCGQTGHNTRTHDSWVRQQERHERSDPSGTRNVRAKLRNEMRTALPLPIFATLRENPRE